MARDPFRPSDPFGRNFTSGVPQANHSNDVPASAAGGVAAAAHEFAGSLRRIADQTLEREGLEDASADIASGGGAFRGGFAKDDQAYDAALRSWRVTQRQASVLETLGEIERQHPDNPDAFGQAAEAAMAGYRAQPTGDPEADIQIARGMATAVASARERVRGGFETRRRQIARGAFIDMVSLNETVMGQAIAGAGFDDAGAARATEVLTGFAGELSRYGPRAGFSLGGVDFAPDPSRQDAVAPEELGRIFDTAQRGLRTTWIMDAFERAPDAASRRAFAGQVQERWASGDVALFGGFGAEDMARLSGQMEAGVNRAENDEDAARRGAAGLARQMLRAGEFGGEVDPAELRAQAAASGDAGLIAETEFALTNGFLATPASVSRDVAAGGGFAGSAAFLLDHLEGPGFVANDNGRGRAVYGVTEASHPEFYGNGRNGPTRAEALGVARQYWDAIGGDTLDPELALAALSVAYHGGIGGENSPVFRHLRAAGGDVDRFLALEEARLRGLARDNPARYGDDLNGWMNRLGKVRGQIAGMRAQRRSADGYASNPIDYARGTGTRAALATVPEFDPAGAFGDEAAGQAWAAGLRERAALGEALSRRDGVPPRILDNAEAAYYRTRLTEDPGLIVPLARRAYQAVGGQGVTRLMTELGRAGVAQADLHLARLATDPQAAGIVDLVLSGRRLRAGGARAPVWEREGGATPSLDAAMRDLGPALESVAALSPAVRSLAEDMAIADMAAGRLQTPTAYVNSALGATRHGGRRYGGAATVNGQVTISPSWLEADRLDDALGVAARLWVQNGAGPRFSNGQPVPAAQLERARLRLMPNGQYELLNPATGRPYAAASGEAFRFNIEAESFRGVLQRRLGDEVVLRERR